MILNPMFLVKAAEQGRRQIEVKRQKQ